MKEHNIFISYSRSDSAFVRKLEEDLARSGVFIWFDQKRISAGKLWDRAIEEALEMSGILIVVVSPKSALSENVANEVQYAREEGKIIVPILIEQTKIPLTWRRYQRIDFIEDYEAGLNNLAQTLKYEMSQMINSETEKDIQQLKEEAEAKAKYEEEQKIKAEEERRIRAEAEAKQKAEEERRIKAEAEIKRIEDEKIKKELLLKEKVEAKAKQKAEQDRRIKAEAKQKAEEERRISADAEAKRIEEEKVKEELLIKGEKGKRIKEELEAKQKAEAKRIEEEKNNEELRLKEVAEAIRKADEQQRLYRESEAKQRDEEEKRLKEEVEAKRIKRDIQNDNLVKETAIFTTSDVANEVAEVKIGNQIWMAKNLDVSFYRNGDPIPEVKDRAKWENLTTGAWCYYNNDPAIGAVYGKLYNWYAVNDPRDLAPKGWHIPTDDEWTTLTKYIGNEALAGGKLKEPGTTHWESPNEGGTNESGFSALPGGYRLNNGSFFSIGYYGLWWSSTEFTTSYAWCRDLYYSYSFIFRYSHSKELGFSVRCVRD